MKKIVKISAASLLLCALLLVSVGAFYAILIPKSVSCFVGEDIPSYLGATLCEDGEGKTVGVSSGSYRLFGAIPVKSVRINRIEDAEVYVGGVPFGIKFNTEGLTVVGFEGESESPAYRAGLKISDTVVKVNGRTARSLKDISSATNGGKDVELTYLRAGREGTVKITPIYSEKDKRYTLGVYLKDSGAGLGTLTYAFADGTFGGLGHGICDAETGELIPIRNGQVLGVALSGVRKGEKGAPGELKGYFNTSKAGSLYRNTECGVFGTLSAIPSQMTDKTYKIGLRGELKEGRATLLCTVGEGVREEYEIEISSINLSAEGNKCFSVRITDEKLISRTGGIVQGMSGSPIIQNGKLVGALTHVLVNDPTRGYGIFIENMISVQSELQKSAA